MIYSSAYLYNKIGLDHRQSEVVKRLHGFVVYKSTSGSEMA